MKIFNWLHRRFNHNAEGYALSPKRDYFPYNVDKSNAVTIDTDAKALLEGITFVDVWKDGLLTIGTLGFVHAQEEEEEHQHDEPSTVNEGQVKPIVVKAIQVELVKVENPVPDAGIAKPDVTVRTEEMPDTLPLLKHIESQSAKKRVTLAELLSAEVDAIKMPDTNKLKVDHGTKTADTEKTSVPLSGKKSKEDDSRPRRKLSRMISKMLKKKIYPDVKGNSDRNDGTNEAEIDKAELKHSERTEKVFLLQDAVSQC